METMTLSDLHEILDKIQIASLYTSGKKELRTLVEKVEHGSLFVEDLGKELNTYQELQELINDYDSSIKIKEII
ncbi:hypothetical protein [Fulvivirga sediminis]|uniref:Uncharacterized protein n=1 Tax=Fulvivirga sediminis TaxID=2803949 RepID=A0A937FE98_9BACT|nr:hypothetical protein [Fulvivirga sediminis]MBL3658803.1 hypothetical protein [Fulvivirga sediminis]